MRVMKEESVHKMIIGLLDHVIKEDQETVWDIAQTEIKKSAFEITQLHDTAEVCKECPYF